MNTPLDSLIFYTKLLTGLVLLLNLLSLVSIHLLVRWVKNPSRILRSSESNPFPEQAIESKQFRGSARFILMALLLVVISINGLAIYGNSNLRKATDSVIAQMMVQ